MRFSRFVRACALVALYCVAAPLHGAGAGEAGAAAPTDVTGIPPAPRAAIRRWVGQYGSEAAWLTIYEKDGQLYADGRGIHPTAPTASPVSTSMLVRVHGHPVIRWEGMQLPRIDVGARVVQRIRAGARADAAALRADALKQTPPIEEGRRRPGDLVDLASNPAIKFDIRYATSNNFMGFPLYEKPRAYLQRPAAQALDRVAARLAREGYGLLVYDAYRPWFVTRMFWDATPETAHVFVADPATGSRHNRGCAVDLTLYRLSDGEPVPMPGRYDEMSQRSYPDFVGGTSEQRGYRDLLRRAMETEGFTVYAEEWWHFDYKDWDQYSIGNATFDEVRAAGTAR